MNIRKDYDQAKKHYKKSLESKPNNATFNGNYANLLKGIRKNYDQAEKHYKKALKTEPDHANNNGNYAQFLFIKE
jgi:tetratricopeptide (TPR) repeat protein